MEIETIIFDDSAGMVDYRNGVEVCVFVTQSGKEVLFSRDKNGNVVKSFEGKLSSVDFVKARGIAGPKLKNKFLTKDVHFTTKVVSAPVAPPRAQAAQKGPKPAWLQTRLAAQHAQTISTHTDDD